MDNSEAADRVIEATYRTCGTLAQHPKLGCERPFSEPGNAGLRSFVITDFPNYLIFYRVYADAVQIVRVLHGARDTS